MPDKITAIIVGAGHRSLVYASYSREHPDELEIVGVADPTPLRRQQVAEMYGLSAGQCWETAQDLASHGRQADVIINGTMDHQHVPTSLPLLEAGYHMLLEKPFATSEQEMWQLVETTRRCDRQVVICHVLRYAPFYAAIRQQVADGALGDILNIQAVEHVSYHHVAVGFVRGKWSKKGYCQGLLREGW